MNFQFCICLFLLSSFLYKLTNKQNIIFIYFICNIPFCFINGNCTFGTRIKLIILLSIFSISPLLLCGAFNYIANKKGYEILGDSGVIKKNGENYTGKLYNFLIFANTFGWFSIFTVPFIFLLPYIYLI